MAIQFVVEDGTSKTDATSYATVAQYKQYWENRGTDYSAVANTTIQAYLNSSTEYIDNNYNFKGTKTDDDQSLEWPRNGVGNCSGIYYDSDEMPQELIDATCYIGAKAGSELDPVSSNVNSISYGPVSKSYSGSSTEKSYKVAEKLLKCTVIAGNGLLRVN